MLRRLLPVVLVAVALVAAAPAVASAATLFVATTGDDTGNDCQTDTAPCRTIQHAVDQATDADSIEVDSGTYNESVTVDVGVEIDGPYAGFTPDDPDRDPADEARIVGVSGSPAVTLDADGASLVGLAIGPETGPAADGTVGVAIPSGHTQPVVLFTIIENVARGVDVGGTGFFFFAFNAVRGATDAGIVASAVDSPFIVDNELSDGTGDGIRFMPDATTSTMVTFENNNVHDLGGDGIVVVPGSMADPATIDGNRIVGTGGAGLVSSIGDVDARWNWWGCNEGPNQPGCDEVSGTGESEYTPWTVMTLTADPTVIATGGDTSDINASFNTDSNGDSIPGPGVPDMLDVAFTTSLGTIEPSSCTCGGEAFVQLTSGDTAGTADVSATLDNETQTTQVQFEGPTATITPDDVDFGAVEVGKASPRQGFTVRNTGSTPFAVDEMVLALPDPGEFQISAGEDNCTGRTLAPNEKCGVKVRFTPTGAAGSRSSALTLVSGSPVAAAPIRGTAVAPANARLKPPGPVDFGTVLVGRSSPRVAFSVKNTGKVAVTIGTVTIDGPNADQFETQFPGSRDTCSDATLDPGESCTLRVRFTPTSGGAKTAQLSVPSADLSGPVTAKLDGTGSVVADLRATPSPMDFGAIALGSMSKGRKVTVRNTGGSDVTLGSSAITGTDAGQFAILDDGCDGVTLAPNQFCRIRVRFTPAGAEGPRSAALEIPSDAFSDPLVDELQGIAAAA